MGKKLTVCDTANLIGVSTDTIRRWDKKGLIRGGRSSLNYRIYDLEEVKRLHEKIKGINRKNKYKILKTNKKSP